MEESSAFFILMPEKEEEFRAALEFINCLTKAGKRVILFANKIQSVILGQDYPLVEVAVEDITKLGLPSKKLTNILAQKKFDVVIDLNISENLFYSVAANIVSSSYRIGFNKENSDRFYNLQIINNEINSAISYRNLLNSLQMF